jgi:hypothetical protein
LGIKRLSGVHLSKRGYNFLVTTSQHFKIVFCFVWLKDHMKMCKLPFRVPMLCSKNNVDFVKKNWGQKVAKLNIPKQL